MSNHWNTPLGLATRHDKARARAARLRAEADRLDAKADDLSIRFQAAMAEAARRWDARGGNGTRKVEGHGAARPAAQAPPHE